MKNHHKYTSSSSPPHPCHDDHIRFSGTGRAALERRCLRDPGGRAQAGHTGLRPPDLRPQAQLQRDLPRPLRRRRPALLQPVHSVGQREGPLQLRQRQAHRRHHRQDVRWPAGLGQPVPVLGRRTRASVDGLWLQRWTPHLPGIHHLLRLWTGRRRRLQLLPDDQLQRHQPAWLHAYAVPDRPVRPVPACRSADVIILLGILLVFLEL